MQRLVLRVTVRLAPRVFLLGALVVMGCASQPDLSVEEQVGNRALQWADALMALDYDKALAYMTPSYQNGPRAQRFKGEYRGASFWRDAEIMWVRCEEETGIAPTGTAPILPTSEQALGSVTAPEYADDCIVGTWNVCGDTSPVTAPASTAISGEGTRCVVRMVKTVMMPPEMSFPMPLASNYTWLNLDGVWYLYSE